MVNKFILTLLFCMCFWQSKAQESDTEKIEQICMNYTEGFSEGHSSKIKSSIKPSLYKFGYWKKTNTEVYVGDGHITFQQSIDYSNDVLKNKNFAKSNATKKVKARDISNHIAAAKITAWWGIDYVLLSRFNDGWLIEEALWEDPLEKQSNVLSISYIGNMGVLLANNDNVVIIDGFHKKYKPEYAYPSESTVEKIINGEYQNFKKPDIALVTHHHKDHFDADYYRMFLQKNPESIVVASQQTSDLIHEGLNSDELEMSSALKQVLYLEEEYSGVYQNIEIKAFKCPHVNSARHSSVQNIAYLISMGNYSILHLGDTNWDVAESILKKKKISDISLDVAILPYWMLLNKNSIEKVNILLAPKRIIATHIPPDFSDTEYKYLQNKHSNITLLTELNEQIKYK